MSADIAQLKKQMRELNVQDEMEQVRREMRDLQESYNAELQSLRTAMRKQKGEWVRQLNDALGKVDKQGKLIAAQQAEIDVLKRQVGTTNTGKGRLLEASSNNLGKKNKTKRQDDEEGSESSCELPGLYGHLTCPKKSNNSNNSSGENFHLKATESFMHDSFRPMDDDYLDEGDGNVEMEFEFAVPLPDSQEEDHEDCHVGASNNGKANRRGSLDSVQTWDMEEPRRKTISLLPHKSVQIYNEQRADTVLRKLMRRGKNEAISVRKVHGKNLVFFHDRIYIPAGLRQKTLAYYYQKYRKQTPILHLEKNCYWPDMKLDMRIYENKAGGKNWKVRVS